VTYFTPRIFSIRQIISMLRRIASHCDLNAAQPKATSESTQSASLHSRASGYRCNTGWQVCDRNLPHNLAGARFDNGPLLAGRSYLTEAIAKRDGFPSPLTRRARKVRREQSGRVVRRRPLFGRLV
jgi:hypothetical protein